MSHEIETYQPQLFEDEIYQYWEQSGYFKPAMKSGAPPFCMIKPPPNVTGALHMGHALTDTIEDAIVRHKRMKGYNTLFVPGTDHASIATQTVIERRLAAEKKSRFELGREKFLDIAWDHTRAHQKIINDQMRKMGNSMDWDRYCFTMDPKVARGVKHAFCRLYHEGLIYRGERMISWCPKDQTALSDLEVEQRETKGHMWRVRYPLVDQPDQWVAIETTRPETIFADTAVAVHPDDTRYKRLIGTKVRVPVVNREVPIIADEYVDPAFGTGALKVTPGHDFNDFEIGQRHKLEVIQILDKRGRMTGPVGAYAGMSALECRAAFVAELEQIGLLEGVRDHLHYVGYSQRSGSIVEPMLSTQWFIKIKPLADPAIRAVQSGEIRFIPAHWAKTYFEWMYNIRDWCISRQLWWGHPIPAAHCQDCGGVTVSEDAIAKCEHCGSSNVQADADILDTWFSSGLWPFVTLGWPEETADYKTFYPNQMLETGFDIIFFWVARMIMFGIKFTGKIPFEEVFFHAMVRDEHGHKMSKTRGNTLDPLEIVRVHGADSLRFTLASLAAQGRDIKLSKERVEGYRNFMNKIWNARRFLEMNRQPSDSLNKSAGTPAHVINQWLMSRFNRVVEAVDAAYAAYDLSTAAHALYQFFWHEYCDWYLEFAKVLLKDSGARQETLDTAFRVFRDTLKLMHPLIPFMTEKLFQEMPNKDHEALIITPMPEADRRALNEDAEAAVSLLQEITAAARRIRSLTGIPPGKMLPLQVDAGVADKTGARQLAWMKPYIETMARAAAVEFAPPADVSKWLRGVFTGGQVYLDPAGAIDVRKELARIEKELSFVETGKKNIEKKLANKAFVEKAPSETVAAERVKLDELSDKHALIADIAKTLKGMTKNS